MKEKEETIEFVCECNARCPELVTLTIEEAARIAAHHPGWVVISNDCKNGAEFTDRLIERHEHYAIYEEAT